MVNALKVQLWPRWLTILPLGISKGNGVQPRPTRSYYTTDNFIHPLHLQHQCLIANRGIKSLLSLINYVTSAHEVANLCYKLNSFTKYQRLTIIHPHCLHCAALSRTAPHCPALPRSRTAAPKYLESQMNQGNYDNLIPSQHAAGGINNI